MCCVWLWATCYLCPLFPPQDYQLDAWWILREAVVGFHSVQTSSLFVAYLVMIDTWMKIRFEFLYTFKSYNLPQFFLLNYKYMEFHKHPIWLLYIILISNCFKNTWNIISNSSYYFCRRLMKCKNTHRNWLIFYILVNCCQTCMSSEYIFIQSAHWQLDLGLGEQFLY